MKKLLLLFVASLTMLFVGCSQFDDSRIWDAIDELEDLYDDLDGRLEKLEEECQKMNTNIEALQTLVTALQNHDTITSIAPIKQGDEIVGYTITFSQSEPITIYHGTDGKDGADGEDGKDGADGKDGYTPTIGVAQDEDGIYYWTLDGEWLLDAEGNKIKAVGEDGKDGANGNDGANGENGTNGENGENGKDGITPQLEIRDGYWYISYDNGATWKELGKATGEDGKDGADGEDGKDGEDGTNGTDGQDGKDGDSLFQSVTWDEEYAYFTLADGTVIKIPLASDSEAEEGDLPPANEIWYTSTDGEVVTPYNADAFGVNIISNTYENGVGIITFDGDVTSIGNSAFYYCSSLASITIPDSVTSIGDYAFFGCTSLTSITIPNSVTSIGISVFGLCSSLASVTIPDSVTSIREFAFSDCSSLAEFRGKFASSDGRCLIIDGVLHSFAPAGLTEYTIPEGVTSIGVGAFGGYSSLASVTIPDSVTSIEYCAFMNCSSLASITIPDSVTSIGDYAFDGCLSLASVTIPDSVTSIGKCAFTGCSSLAEFRGKFALSDGRCLIIDGVLNSFAPAGLTEYTIPEGVTSIGEEAFSDCDSLNSITIPDSVTSIGYYAFSYCESLTSITIPDGVTTIGGYACAGCTSLTRVYCKPTTPPSGDWDMFDYNASRRKIYVPTESVEAYKAAEYWSDYADYIVGYDFENGGSGEDTTTPPANEIWYTSTDGEVVTPYKIYAFGVNIISNTYEHGVGIITFDGDVTSIGDWAFSERSSLASVIIPDSVTSIGNYAFYWCSSLASVTIPDSVTEIGNYAFAGCSSLAEFRGKFASEDGRCLIIDGVLNSFAPAGLTEYTISDSVTSIGEGAFCACSSLASVIIPDSVTSIGVWVFNYCTSLTSITIPDSVTWIGNYAFRHCSSLAEFRGKFASSDGRCLIIDGVLNSFAPAGLTEYTIPDSVTSIGLGAFYGCSSLASVTIPDSVTSIGDYAFVECESLASVYCKPTTPPIMGYNPFYYTLANIYVPEGCVEAYKSADGWSQYAYAIKEYAPANYASWLGSYTISGIGSVYDSEADSRVEREVEFTITVEAKDESTLSYNVTGWDGCPYPITAYYGSEDELILSAGMVVEGLDLGDGTYSDMGDLYCVGVLEDNYILTGGPIIKLSKDANQVVGITIDGDEVLGITFCFQAYEDGVFYLLKRYGLLYTPMDMAVSSGASYAPKKAVAFGGRNLGIDRTRTLRVVK